METAGEVRLGLMHDLRTPLQVVYSCAQMIGMEMEEHAAAGIYIEMLMENVREVQRMLANHLEDEKARAQKLRAERGDIVGCVREVCRGFRVVAQEEGTNLIFRTNAARLEMRFDAEKIARILHNLLSNALRYTPPGGEIRVSFEALGDFVEVHVRDSGRGIGEEERERIFDYMYSDGGCGLGLGLARGFARMHGGELRVESAEGRGSTFTLRLPTGEICERAM